MAAMMTKLGSDVRYTARSLCRSPGFALAAIVTIALGVGVNAGIFSILNGVLFRNLPAADAHELVSLDQTVEGGDFTSLISGPFTIADYRTLADRAQTVAVLAYTRLETTLGGDAPQKVTGAIVSCNWFGVLRTPPVLGRALNARDCEPGAPPVVVLAHALWTTSFGADPGVVGRTIELAGDELTVIGIAAAGTYGGASVATAYFAPLGTEPLLWPRQSRYEDQGSRWLHLLGRRSAGASIAQVRAELAVIAAQIDQAAPGRSTTLTVARAKPNAVPGDLRGPATALLAPFALILLIACANVANLSLARGTARAREIGIRMSLGASRARVVRQLMTESVLISIAGGVLGSLLAVWSFQSLVAFALPAVIHPEIPVPAFELDFSADFRVLWYALALTVGTGLVFGLAPALAVSKPDLNTVIKQDSASAGSARSGGRLRGTLVGVQVALCMALMIATGLLLRGLYATYTIDPGFNPEGVAHLSFGTDGGPPILDRRMLEEVAALPGVEGAAYAVQTPLGESQMGGEFRLPGEPESEARGAEIDFVTPSYFSVIGLPLVRGRSFTEAESADSQGELGTRPAIVSETTARNFWGDSDPIGRTLVWQDSNTTLEVVGVAADARLVTLGEIDAGFVYMPLYERGELLVKTRADFASTASGILAIVRARDAGVVGRVLPLESNVQWYRGLSQVVTTLGAGLGLLALVLAAVGVYGVVSYSVTRRYREIGIRMALGAEKRDLLTMIFRGTMRPVVVGALIGLVAAGALSRVLSSLLFGVNPADPIGFGGAVLLVLAVALAAGVVAALPATHAQPTTTLRYE